MLGAMGTQGMTETEEDRRATERVRHRAAAVRLRSHVRARWAWKVAAAKAVVKAAAVEAAATAAASVTAIVELRSLAISSEADAAAVRIAAQRPSSSKVERRTQCLESKMMLATGSKSCARSLESAKERLRFLCLASATPFSKWARTRAAAA